jgi:hypothetical protein
VWRETPEYPNDEIYFARLTEEGTMIGSVLRVTTASSYSRRPDIAWSGSEYVLVWEDWRDFPGDIYMARISPSTGMVGTDMNVVDTAEHSWYPSIVHTGSELGIAWSEYYVDNFEMQFGRFAYDGTAIGTSRRLTTTSEESLRADLVFTGTEFGLAWCESTGTVVECHDVYHARLLADGGDLGGTRLISNAPGKSQDVSLASRGFGYAITWYDDRDGNTEIYLGVLECAD